MNMNETIRPASYTLQGCPLHTSTWGHRLPPQSSEVGTDYAASWTTMDMDIGMSSVVAFVLFKFFVMTRKITKPCLYTGTYIHDCIGKLWKID